MAPWMLVRVYAFSVYTVAQPGWVYTMRHIGILVSLPTAYNWSACADAQSDFFILLAGLLPPGPVVFYPLRGCSLILHARPA